MDILIKDMDIPKSCNGCPFNLIGYCIAYKGLYVERKNLEYNSKPEWCPLIPVPAHGRLGDLDELLKRIKEEGCNQAEFYADRYHPVVLAYGDCYGKVKNAPTIIPASEERK